MFLQGLSQIRVAHKTFTERVLNLVITISIDVNMHSYNSNSPATTMLCHFSSQLIRINSILWPIMPSSCDRAFNISKGKGIGNGGSWVQVLVGTVYYIVIEVFNFKKKIASYVKELQNLGFDTTFLFICGVSFFFFFDE